MDSNREHPFTFSEAISLLVNCETQEEVDVLWEKLSMGGKTGECFDPMKFRKDENPKSHL